MTSEIGETFTALRERSRARRANNRSKSADMLRAAGVAFVARNGGAHLIVAGRWDAWPGTGLWVDRTTKERGRGVRELIRALRSAGLIT